MNDIIQKEMTEGGNEEWKDNGKGTALYPCNVIGSVVLLQESSILCRGGRLAHQTQAKELTGSSVACSCL